MNKENASRNGKKVKDSIDILKNVGNQGEGSISNDVGVLIWVNRLLLIMVNKEILQNKHFFFSYSHYPLDGPPWSQTLKSQDTSAASPPGSNLS